MAHCAEEGKFQLSDERTQASLKRLHCLLSRFFGIVCVIVAQGQNIGELLSLESCRQGQKKSTPSPFLSPMHLLLT